jgi:vacuolar iron transporter family protein
MLSRLKSNRKLYQTRFSFGVTSAIITNLGLISGLDTLSHPKLSIIGGILLIAFADNIADSLGIHIYQESECIIEKDAWLSTITNFLARAFVSLTFVFLVAVLQIKLAVFCSMVWGLALLTIMSYAIAKVRKVNPFMAIFEHVGIAVGVIIASHLIGKWIIGRF